MERSSRNFQSSSNDGKFQAIFASPNIYFTENARWVPLNKFRILRQREMWFPKSRTLYRLRSSGQDLSYRKLWTLRKESHFVITQSVSNQSITESHRHLSRKTSEFTTVLQSAVIIIFPALMKNITQTANLGVLCLKDRSMTARFAYQKRRRSVIGCIFS